MNEIKRMPQDVESERISIFYCFLILLFTIFFFWFFFWGLTFLCIHMVILSRKWFFYFIKKWSSFPTESEGASFFAHMHDFFKDFLVVACGFLYLNSFFFSFLVFCPPHNFVVTTNKLRKHFNGLVLYFLVS